MSASRYNNKTSYYFDRELGTCKEVAFPVGILTPYWLANATYLGTDSVDTYDTHVWTKSDGFIKYWADMKTGLPVTLSSTLAATHMIPGCHFASKLSTRRPCKGCQGHARAKTVRTVAKAPGQVLECTGTPAACTFVKLK